MKKVNQLGKFIDSKSKLDSEFATSHSMIVDIPVSYPIFSPSINSIVICITYIMYINI